MDYLEQVRERPVWRSVPGRDPRGARRAHAARPTDPAAVYQQFREHILPYPTGNIHPRFWGWVMGTGTPLAMLADMLASGMNAHLAGYDQSPALVERQVIRWMAELLGFPAGSSGLLVSGGTVANLVGLAVARNDRAGFDVRAEGLQRPGTPRLLLYGSSETHSWARKTSELLGTGRQRLPPHTGERRLRGGRGRAARGHRRRPRGGAPAVLRHRQRRHGQHRRDRRPSRAGGALPGAGPLVPCGRRVRRVRGAGAVAPLDRGGTGAGRLGRGGSPQVGLPAVRGRARAGAPSRGAPRHLRHRVELSRRHAARHRRRRPALRRAGRAALARFSRAQGVDVAQVARGRRLGPAGRAERGAGAGICAT